MNKFRLYHHFLVCFLITIFSLAYPTKLILFPWITFQVAITKDFNYYNGLKLQFLLGLCYSMISSNFPLGTFSLFFCFHHYLLSPLNTLFIDQKILASSLFAAIFGFSFSISEFLFHQIFFSNLHIQTSTLILHFLLKFFTDFILSLFIFSWLYFIDFSILKFKEIIRKFEEKKRLQNAD